MTFMVIARAAGEEGHVTTRYVFEERVGDAGVTYLGDLARGAYQRRFFGRVPAAVDVAELAYVEDADGRVDYTGESWRELLELEGAH